MIIKQSKTESEKMFLLLINYPFETFLKCKPNIQKGNTEVYFKYDDEQNVHEQLPVCPIQNEKGQLFRLYENKIEVVLKS